MSPPDVRSLFGRALDFDSPAERAAYLDKACAGDPAARERVEALLAAHDRAGGFLQAPPAAAAPTADYEPAPAPPASSIGPYKLLEKIGEGGMGEVWVADQQEPIRRRVALKVIKPGMDSRSVLARFEAERQALALMDHPNIAKVHDAGTTDGRPYFVMELVKGTPITEFCDARKLSPRERLELFVPVCQAIQHAHTKGIIHRDIKPSNVLVELHDDRAVPKVIDFGVAKAVGQRLTEKTLYTGFGALVGTPAYMAPEQATFNALDVDTRADVYALGVLLYELLAGSPPVEPARFREAALDEVLRLVREEEPPRPSARLSTSQARASIAAVRQSDPARLAQLVRGELDWIVMKALEKDRTRRYETASGFAADVQRYLGGEPVQAVPPSAGYRMRKFARKHRARVTVAAALAAALVGGVVGTTVGMVRATRAAGDALDAQADAVAESERASQAAEELRAEQAKLRAEQDRIRRLLYASVMAGASFALAEGRSEHVVQALVETTPQPDEPDVRGWEWNYLNRLFRPTVRELRLGAALPMDGSHLAKTALGPRMVVTRYDGRGVWFEVFDATSGKQLGRVPKTGTLKGWEPRSAPLRGELPTPLNFSTPSLPDGVLDDGARHLAALCPVKEDGKVITRVRLWRVDTGEELADGPGGTVAGGTGLRLGPNAEWVAWVEANRPRQDPLMSRESGPVTVHRWNRAGKTLTSRTFTPAAGASDRTLTRDGRYAIVDPYRPAVGPGMEAPPKQQLESWDLTPDTPVRRYPPIPLGEGRAGRLAVSPGGTAAAFWDGTEVVVYDLGNGKAVWRHPHARRSGVSLIGMIAGVSDDGRRVVFREPLMLTVVEHPDPSKAGTPREWSIRHRPVLEVPERSVDRGGGDLRTLPAQFTDRLSGTLSPDGRAFYHATLNNPVDVAVFDLSADPQWAGPAFRPRRTVERAGAGEWSIHDADGKELGRIKSSSPLQQPVRDRWVVVNPPAWRRPVEPQKWQLFDVHEPTAPRLTASDVGEANVTPDGRWLIVRNPEAIPNKPGPNVSACWTATTIRRPESGLVVSRIEAPPGTAFRTHQREPGGELLAAVTYPADPQTRLDPLSNAGLPRKPVPLTLRLYDIGTGRERWAKDIGTAFVGFSGPAYSRDGRRVFTVVRDNGDRATVRIHNTADGSTDHSFAVPEHLTQNLLGEAGDGKLIFGRTSDVEFWDPATGTRTHRLTGHESSGGQQVACSLDGRRLFVLAHSNGSRGASSARLHVWDLTTGREVLKVAVPTATVAQQRSQAMLDFADGKLRYTSVDGLRELDGTPPQAPAK